MAVQQQEIEFCVWNLKPDRLQSVAFREIIALYNQKRYYLKKGGEKKEKERDLDPNHSETGRSLNFSDFN